uniref:NADH-ubiquinone oxidoreductase chain 5 n=2 Tax=Trigonopteryx hopei TaxID=62799 RepID=M4JDT3_9ORTH|nr:NADH dehydrogenase subunit 5 [Trigonopteryx hopei]
MNLISVCLLSFLMFFIMGLFFFFWGIYFLLIDYSLFIDWEFFSLNGSMIVMTMIFDWISLIFMSFVMFISSLVIYYSEGYMFGDYNINRFIILVNMFVLSMMFLIISPNLISILLGWDGLGLISYCLVIYYQNIKSNNAGMITALTNRLGDVSILLSIAWMLNNGSWNYIFYCNFNFDFFEMSYIGMMIILAAMTKSAQIPFSSWLPSAMAAPTPVSALVHSSTLVTAGVYLLIRFNEVLLFYNLNLFVLLVGCLTMFMAGLGANFEYDLSKIIALSTLSQLGLMMSILSMGFPKLAFFHLLTHALFKSLLFLCAGSMIHNLNGSQDIRFMGSLIYFMPLTSICFNVSNLSLCGFPFLSGFYSSDLIIDMMCMNWLNFFFFFLFFFSVGLTVSYSFRLFYYSIIGDNNFYSSFSFFDNDYYMSVVMFIQLFIVIFGGSMLSWLIFPIPNVVILPFFLKLMVLLFMLIGLYSGYLIYIFYDSYYYFSLNVISLMNFFGLMWFLPYLSSNYLIFFPLSFSYYSFTSFDMSWGEMMGGQGLYNLFIYILSYIQSIYDLNFKIYLMFFSGWVFILVLLMFFII